MIIFKAFHIMKQNVIAEEQELIDLVTQDSDFDLFNKIYKHNIQNRLVYNICLNKTYFNNQCI